MGVHDWTKVDAGVFHDFHTVWIGNIRTALNGRLPEGYYALAEQHAGETIADILTLHTAPEGHVPEMVGGGGVALAEAPPRTRARRSVQPTVGSLRRTLSIRHVSGHRLVAMLEIVSPANKDRPRHVTEFATKAAEALHAGIHLLVLDLFPPTANDPGGMHTAIRQRLDDQETIDAPPPGEPLTLASYVAGERIEIFLEYMAIGASVPQMPLFLQSDRYINVPLAETYDAAYRGMPAFWRNVLEQEAPSTPPAASRNTL